MKLPISIIDAFASGPMTGNPAAVVPLDTWLDQVVMQAIAAEMNLSETVFFVPAKMQHSQPKEASFEIKWFTPIKEVDMIGHATLAAGHYLVETSRARLEKINFISSNAVMAVGVRGDALELDMPALPPTSAALSPQLAEALGAAPHALLAAKHYLAVFERADDVAALRPDFAALAALPLPAVIVTAPGEGEFDFVSRFFAPANGVNEDPVSGVAHCCLAPYWSARLGHASTVGRQLSERGGIVKCETRKGRVVLSGRARTFLDGTIHI